MQFGGKLSEGDPPAGYIVDQEQMKKYATHWKHIRAYAEDSTGEIYRSKPAKEQPSWAKPV
jgi:NADPH-dependent 7-cyano-7-deazaguanine reductase QueF